MFGDHWPAAFTGCCTVRSNIGDIWEEVRVPGNRLHSANRQTRTRAVDVTENSKIAVVLLELLFLKAFLCESVIHVRVRAYRQSSRAPIVATCCTVVVVRTHAVRINIVVCGRLAVAAA